MSVGLFPAHRNQPTNQLVNQILAAAHVFRFHLFY